MYAVPDDAPTLAPTTPDLSVSHAPPQRDLSLSDAQVPAASAGGVVLAHFAQQIKKIETNDPLVRQDAPDAVHQMRVATRRLRSALTTFRPLFHRGRTDPLRDELRWLGEMLGGARDAEVIRDHLRHLLTEVPAEEVRGPVERRIVETMSARYRTAHAAVLVEIDGPRYRELVVELAGLLADPPLRGVAGEEQSHVLLPLVGATAMRLERLNRQLERTSETEKRSLVLHEIRKAAKAARYAGEAMVPAFGAPAKEWAVRMSAIQDLLGIHQDTVVIRGELRALALGALEHFEDSFTYGRLDALERERAAAAEADYAFAWVAASEAGVNQWLRAPEPG